MRTISRLIPMLIFMSLAGLQPALAQAPGVGKLSQRRLHCMGQSWNVKVYETEVAGEVLLRADDPALNNAARALGRDLHWSVSDQVLSSDQHSLGVDQPSINGRQLQVRAQFVEQARAIHIPSSALEELLSAKVTIKRNGKGAIYLEPTLQSLDFVEEAAGEVTLRATTSVPVRKKVFTLSRPSRTVVDLVGLAIPGDGKHPGLEHPGVGEIKVGQFQLAPAITRIVIPTDGKVKVKTPRSLDLYEHKLTLNFPPGRNQTATQTTPSPLQTPVPPTERVEVVQIPPQPSLQPESPPDEEVQWEEDAQPEEEVEPNSGRTLLLAASWEGNRLKLEFSDSVEYRWSRLDDRNHRFFVDFPQVVFPKKKTQLNSSVPGLERIRIVQNMPEPEPVVRLVCDLDTPLAVTTDGKNERVLYLDFPGRRISSHEVNKGIGFTGRKAPSVTGGGRTICLDAGHGGSDPGAINRDYGVSEKQVTLDITLRLAQILKAEGWNVILTRSVDRDVSWAGSSGKQELGARADKANQYGADLFVSIHCNASTKPSIHGTSIHWYKSSDLSLARLMEGSVMHGTGRSNRGLIKNRFYVLAHTHMPAVLIETAFLTNPHEGKLLADPNYRDRVAQGIAAGLRTYAAYNFSNPAANR